MTRRIVIAWSVLTLAACGPSYWRPPARTIPEETIGADAKIEIGISWGVPFPDKPRPAWLGPPGEANNAELASRYGPRMFHNGRLLAFVRLPYQIGAAGTVALAECPSIAALGRTPKSLEPEIETCVARFVDRPQIHVRIDTNPAWTVAIVRGGKTRRVPATALTLVDAVGLALRPELHTMIRHRVALALPNQPARPIDLEAIVNGEQPDIPLAPGDTVIID